MYDKVTLLPLLVAELFLLLVAFIASVFSFVFPLFCEGGWYSPILLGHMVNLLRIQPSSLDIVAFLSFYLLS
ncbi:hypothetical protein O6P43_013537 [Quillaja saponaria]|uniref:Uncharacterized protein n=1 Tax=Quillaja saponaria TaxID=32244 RepID=A0AAD7LSP0_QUISA|nr:hypothetical protein O6P43_013537 [Quillaja saponaria]